MKFIVSRTSGNNLKIKTKDLIARRRKEDKRLNPRKFDIVEVETLEQLLNIMHIEKETEMVIGRTYDCLNLVYENLPEYFIEIYDDYRE